MRPQDPEGKQRSAQNALKHGFRAHKHMVLPGEDAGELAALEAALMEELAPEGALQAALAQRVVSAVWRLSRAERLEAELFAENQLAGRSLGLALIRDGNGSRSFETLLRYRGGALAELWRALRTLKALQAEQAEANRMPAAPPEPRLLPEPSEIPIEPEALANPGPSKPAQAANEPARHPQAPAYAPASEPDPTPAVAPDRLQGNPRPNEPSLGPTQGEAAPRREARRMAPGAIAPPRERRNPAAPPAQPSRSTP